MNRIGIISDIHSNEKALQAALRILREESVDSIVVCGDVVGYGKDVNECCEIVQDLRCPVVAGNHDYAVAGKIEYRDSFSRSAIDGIEYAKQVISKKNLEWLSDLPVQYENDIFQMVHASLKNPLDFKYLVVGKNPTDSCWENAQHSFDSLSKQICFIGHSHVPALFIERGYRRIKAIVPNQLKYNLGNQRAIVDVGSVGLPRVHSHKACMCLFDWDAKTIEFRRFSI